ncbi:MULTISPECIES: hypothetical protein [Atopobiaceae]|uniref:Uncharacterized protein n=1 Tax=Parafannyhessea umbonata TaxID=604330 RepID=A0A1H9P0A6_9ACTN|nr:MULTISPECIES: hypothetical protein [Atopobiaceae]SEH41304.1 hypothetical protein SAMN05216447_1029 [Parafannyhessea umbonata]SER41497.1 hypothetical protein SAMN05216446_0722 [Parafannyhessea umbonata]SJZ54668.1 hypothetical protein SAMN06298223_0670 [Olsenella sp. KH1P3]
MSDSQESSEPLVDEDFATPEEIATAQEENVEELEALPVISAKDGTTTPRRMQTGALDSLKSGLDAVAAVRAAAKQHSDARAQAKQLKKELDKSKETLAHRLDVDRNYDKILAEQKAVIQKGNEGIARAEAAIEELETKKSELDATLAQKKADDEAAIRPYRELMESTKGRSDDAARALAEIRRAVKTADQQVADTAKRREQRIAAANRAVDNAQDRLRKVESDLNSLKGSSTASPNALSKMQSELVAERAHLDAAREDVGRVTAECQQLVDNAQTHLWTQKQSLETAERAADDAKREADGRREEYESLYNKAMGGQKEIEARIAEVEKDIDARQTERAEQAQVVFDAQALVDEADDIHSTPEVTKNLQDAIATGKVELEKRQREVDALAAEERQLRESTRAQRFLFIGVAAVAIVIIVLIVSFFALPH